MASNATRTILHADMDAFYASVEQRDDATLRGRPLVVGGAAPRGVVAAASYEARTYGIHSAMPTIRALQRCPELVCIAPRMERYAEVSRQVFAIFRSTSPLVEGLSLDEAFIDISGTERLHGSAEGVARAIKERVRRELELVVSLGVGPSKLIAKIASDLDKPDGLRIVRPDEVLAFLGPLPATRLWGVGRVTAERLAGLGIRTIAELAAYPRDALLRRLGANVGAQLHDQAQGIDEREVIPDTPAKSLGAEDTLERDVSDLDELSRLVRSQAEHVGRRLRSAGLVAGVVVLKVKTADFRQRTRQRSLARPCADGAVLAKVALELLPRLLRELDGAALRLTGVTASRLEADRAPQQLSFDDTLRATAQAPTSKVGPSLPPRDGHEFDGERRRGEALARTLDAIAERFGDSALQRGGGQRDNVLRRRDGRGSGGPGPRQEGPTGPQEALSSDEDEEGPS